MLTPRMRSGIFVPSLLREYPHAANGLAIMILGVSLTFGWLAGRRMAGSNR